MVASPLKKKPQQKNITENHWARTPLRAEKHFILSWLQFKRKKRYCNFPDTIELSEKAINRISASLPIWCRWGRRKNCCSHRPLTLHWSSGAQGLSLLFPFPEYFLPQHKTVPFRALLLCNPSGSLQGRGECAIREQREAWPVCSLCSQPRGADRTCRYCCPGSVSVGEWQWLQNILSKQNRAQGCHCRHQNHSSIAAQLCCCLKFHAFDTMVLLHIHHPSLRPHLEDDTDEMIQQNLRD